MPLDLGKSKDEFVVSMVPTYDFDLLSTVDFSVFSEDLFFENLLFRLLGAGPVYSPFVGLDLANVDLTLLSCYFHLSSVGGISLIRR